MMYLDLDGHRYVFASKAGMDTNPDWYHNLVADPAVDVEVGSEHRYSPARRRANGPLGGRRDRETGCTPSRPARYPRASPSIRRRPPGSSRCVGAGTGGAESIAQG